MTHNHIRNFCIIAHIDHGKSTLADRILEYTGALSAREMTSQVLDKMDLERERGITIKAQAVRLLYNAEDGHEYILNLIDTPGHVDFTYEVSRSLAACEGALLIIDATQGIEAQTLANLYLALESNLEIVPVINKIDLPSADPDRVRKEIEDVIGLPGDDAVLTSAKTGLGTKDVLEAVVHRIPPPSGQQDVSTKALIFDSHFDPYKGVIVYVRVMEGSLRAGQRILMMSTKKEYEIVDVGVFKPYMEVASSLGPGEVGFITGSIKNVKDCSVGDTITDAANPVGEALPGYRQATPMVYSGLYPVDNADYEALRDALDKLKLNDASLVYEPESSLALGFGYRCGFLGLLHMEIVYERLQREYNIDLIGTFPSVEYHVRKTDGETIIIDNPAKLPLPTEIDIVEEPYVKASIMVPADYVGQVMELARDKRGIFIKMEYPSPGRVQMSYELPLGEILLDFFDKLKSKTKGYASLDYEYCGHKESQMVKLDIMLNGKPVDALSSIVHVDKAASRGRVIAEKLKDIIPRHQFEVPIQASIGNKIIARETVRAVRKDVTAKCYGGDISRKRKLLEKQKEGKKRMKQFGQVEVPQEAFLAVLRIDEDE